MIGYSQKYRKDTLIKSLGSVKRFDDNIMLYDDCWSPTRIDHVIFTRWHLLYKVMRSALSKTKFQCVCVINNEQINKIKELHIGKVNKKNSNFYCLTILLHHKSNQTAPLHFPYLKPLKLRIEVIIMNMMSNEFQPLIS